ncbi:unnamed protein product [Mucor hiemalis]
MNDSVSILVAVFLILIALRWMLGGNQSNQQQQQQQQGQRRTPPNLQRTGSVETTVDNALRDGGLPLPPPVANSQQNSPNANASGSSSRKSPSHPNLLQRYKIDVQKEALEEEPAKVWESSPDKRQEMLRKRKEFMVLQARKKLAEQQQKKEEADKAAATSVAAAAESSKSSNVTEEDKTSFEEMSVDELNSLTAEQRRDHMLQALQKRTNSP